MEFFLNEIMPPVVIFVIVWTFLTGLIGAVRFMYQMATNTEDGSIDAWEKSHWLIALVPTIALAVWLAVT